MFNKFISNIKKDLTESPIKAVLLTGSLFVVLFLAFLFIYRIIFNQWINPVRLFVDMVSPATLRTYTYSFEGNMPLASHIWYLVVYISGIVVFSGVFIATLTSYIRSQADMVNRGDTRFRMKHHVLILGYDNRLNGTIKALSKNYDVAIGVENSVESLRSELRMALGDSVYKKITFIHANKNDERDLKKKLRVQSAHEIFIIGEDSDDAHDSSNLDCFQKIGSLCGKKMAKCHVFFRDPSTFAIFQSHNGLEKHKENFLPFSFDELWARKILVDLDDQYPKLDYRNENNNIAIRPEKNVHLLIMGMSSLGEMLARVATMIVHYPNYITHGKKTKITIVNPSADTRMEEYTGRYAEFFKLCHYQYSEYTFAGKTIHYDNTHALPSDFLDIEFEFIKSSYSNIQLLSAIEQWGDEDSFLTIAICEDVSYQSMNIASALPHVIYEKAVPVLVYQKGKATIADFLKDSKFKNVKVFGASDADILNEELLTDWAMQLAKAYAVEYEGEDMVNTPKETIWKSSKVSDQWSNIYNVASIPFKLRAFGTSFQEYQAKSLEFNEHQRDLLGRTEHNRWVSEKLMMGYRPTTSDEHEQWNSGKDPKKALKNNHVHDNICPFDELNKTDQGKDIELWGKLKEIVRSSPKHNK